MHDYGSLLTMKEAARVLFGQNDDNARKRAINLLKKNNVQLITTGSKNFVRLDVLETKFGVDVSQAKRVVATQALEARSKLTKGL